MQAITEKMGRIFTNKRFNLIAFCVIAVMILIAYSNTFTSSFHFDDNPSIVDNATIKRVTTENIISLLNGVRPLVYLSLMLNYQLGELNVVGYHIFNIAFHIANSFLVYLLIAWTLSLPVFEGKYTYNAKRMALFAALLFGVHPIQTEAVTYIISRTELLATFFYLGAFLLFIQGVNKRSALTGSAFFIAVILSMTSKEWAVTLPAMLMLYDYLFLSGKSMKSVLSHWKLYVLAIVPWSLVAHTLNLNSNPSLGFNMVKTATGITQWTYLLTSFNVLWTYVRLLFFPIHQNLDYTYPVAKTLFEFPTLLSFLGHIVVVAAAFWLYKKKGWLLIPFGIAWFYINLSPTQSIVPIVDLIFEHRLYMPSIGFFLMFVVAYEDVFEWWETRSASRKSIMS